MTSKYVWDKGSKLIFPYALKDEYVQSGMWPKKGIDIPDDIALEYCGTPPVGKIRGVGGDGLPCWTDVSPASNSELLKIALFELNDAYKKDIFELNSSWLAAAVSEGLTGEEKKNAVIKEISARKLTYASDKASLVAKFTEA